MTRSLGPPCRLRTRSRFWVCLLGEVLSSNSRTQQGWGQVAAGAPHLSEGGAFAGQDDHHGDVISTVGHLQQLDVVLWDVPVPEAGLLVHHVG